MKKAYETERLILKCIDKTYAEKDNQSKIIGSIGFSNIIRGSFLSCHL
ncbi:hypothetical protein [Alkalithermobacter paradoxus]